MLRYHEQVTYVRVPILEFDIMFGSSPGTYLLHNTSMLNFAVRVDNLVDDRVLRDYTSFILSHLPNIMLIVQ